MDAHLHRGCDTHGPISFHTTKLTIILIKSMNKFGRLMQDKIILVNKRISNLHFTTKFIRNPIKKTHKKYYKTHNNS